MKDAFDPPESTAALRVRRHFPLGLALLLAICITGCGRTTTKETKIPRVIVTEPITGTVIDHQDFTGRLEAFRSVEIRARVSGYVTAAPFKEGDVVEAGKSLLFQIDKRPYQADLNQAEANLKVAIADRDLQKQNADRAEVLSANNTITKEEYQTITATYKKSRETVGSLKAARDRAKLYLDYTSVMAPMNGRISRRNVDPGNLVTADTTPLTTLVTEDPMYAYFDVDERTYLDLLESTAPGTKAWHSRLHLPVMLSLANESEFRRTGDVDFVDNRVTATTGTVRMRGVFTNPTKLLKAGMFVRIRLPIGNAYQATLIPDEAIQSDQERKYVWVVNDDKEVQYRSVVLGQAVGELRVIRPPAKGQEGKEGLSLGERVIVAGVQRVRKKVKVDADSQPAPKMPEVPLVGLWEKYQSEVKAQAGQPAPEASGQSTPPPMASSAP